MQELLGHRDVNTPYVPSSEAYRGMICTQVLNSSRLSRSIRRSRRHKAFDFRSKMAEEAGRRGVLAQLRPSLTEFGGRRENFSMVSRVGRGFTLNSD